MQMQQYRNPCAALTTGSGLTRLIVVEAGCDKQHRDRRATVAIDQRVWWVTARSPKLLSH